MLYPLQSINKESEKKFKALGNDNKLEIYSHFVEEDYYYPYETYANISIVLCIGVLLLACLLLYGRSCGVTITPSIAILLKIAIPILAMISFVMVYEAKTTLDACEDEEDQFSSAFSSEDENELSVKVVNGFDAEILEDILTIDQECFPSSWRYEDSRDYYKKMISDTTNMNILLTANEKNVGYLLAIPHNVALTELKDADSHMKEDLNRFYIETAAILPAFRGKNGLNIMLDKLAEQCKNRDISKLSMHARVYTGLSQKMQKMYVVTKMRRIQKWKYYNSQEPTDYLEVAL